MKMKKNILLLLIIFLSQISWAQTESFRLYLNGDAFEVTMTKDFGWHVLDINMSEVWEFGVVRVGDRYANAFTGERISSGTELLQAMIVTGIGSAPRWVGGSIEEFNVESIHSAGTNFDVLSFDQRQAVQIKNGSTSIRILIPAKLNTYTGIVAVTKKNGQGQTIRFSYESEFFPGERELFAGTNLTEIERAAVILNKSWNNDPEYIELIQKHFPDLNPAFFGSVDINMTRQLDFNFGKSMYQHLTDENEEIAIPEYDIYLPFWDFESNVFESVYGAERNWYINLYLLLNFEQNLPLYVGRIQAELQNFAKIPYNQKQYRQITEAEGRELAESALKYLTWGMEYTPSGIGPTDPFETENFPSTFALDGNTPVGKWMDERGEEFDNYLPSKPKSLNEGNPVSPLSRSTLEIEGIEGDFINYIPEQELVEAVRALLTTPYFNESDSSTVGYPIPYVRGGIDTPRTFAWKMLQQIEARRLYLESNEANEIESELRLEGFQSELGTAIDSRGLREDYLSSQYGGENMYGADSPFATERFAGVDELGFFAGAVSMTSFGGYIFDYRNNPQAGFLEAYTRMDPDYRSYEWNNGTGLKTIYFPGLDEDGRPNSDLDEGNAMFDVYRYLPTDLEKTTIVVPDVTLARIGDILLDYDAFGNIKNLGIIVGFTESVSNSYGTEPALLRERVIVLSISREAKVVTLGRWESTTGFSGFSADPLQVSLRRLLRFDPTPQSTGHRSSNSDQTPFEGASGSSQSSRRFSSIGRQPMNGARGAPPPLYDLDPIYGVIQLGRDYTNNAIEEVHVVFKELEENWISNAGMPLKFNLFFLANYRFDGDHPHYFSPLNGRRHQVRFIDAVDPHFDIDEADKANIYNNSGRTRFRFGAVLKNQIVDIAVFSPATNGNTIAITRTAKYFDAEGFTENNILDAVKVTIEN
jgi:hypothetical protein